MEKDKGLPLPSRAASAGVSTRRIGFWAAVVATAVGYAYLIGYIILLARYPITPWNGIGSFAASMRTSYGNALSLLQILALLQAFSIGLIFIVVHECAAPELRIFTRIALVCVTAFVILASINYYVQWVAIRQGILKGNTEGLGLFVQFNFDSPMSAINMLGWTLFYGLAAVALSPAFRAGRIEKWIKWGLIICGMNGVATAIGLAVGAQVMYLTWTVGISVTWYIYPLVAILYGRKKEPG
jgi:hypothetical protein